MVRKNILMKFTTALKKSGIMLSLQIVRLPFTTPERYMKKHKWDWWSQSYLNETLLTYGPKTKTSHKIIENNQCQKWIQQIQQQCNYMYSRVNYVTLCMLKSDQSNLKYNTVNAPNYILASAKSQGVTRRGQVPSKCHLKLFCVLKQDMSPGTDEWNC